MAAVCYSTLHSAEGGNVQRGFRMLHKHRGSKPEGLDSSSMDSIGEREKKNTEKNNSQRCGLDVYQGMTELQKNPLGCLYRLESVF